MKRYGKKIHWNSKAILGLSGVLFILLTVSQIPNYLYIWPWGPDTGYRSAGLSSGHYERRFPAILRDMPLLGLVLVGEGERLVLDYDLSIEEGKARFTLWKWPTLMNRPRDIGPGLIAADDQGRIEIAPGEPGLYRLYMHGHRMQGAVAVDWFTEDRPQRAGNETEG